MKKNKKLIIGIIAIVLVAVIGAGGYFLVNKINENKSIGTEWGDIYYDFIQNNISEDGWNPDDINSVGYDLIDYDIQFIPQENGDPIMILKTVKKSNSDDAITRAYIIYYINEEGQVKKASRSYTDKDDNMYLELLYNVKEEKYKWYIVNKTENDRYYYDISKIVELSKLQNKLGGYDKAKENGEYIKLDHETSLSFVNKDMPPEEIKEDTPISRFEENIIEIQNVPKIEKANIGTIQDLKETKKIIGKVVNEYKTMENVVTDEVKQSVAKSIEKIDNRKATIEKKAEEDKRKKEEEAQKGLKVGNNTLKYGTYIGYVENSTTGENFVLKQNGQCEYGGQSCTYTVGTCNMSQDITVDMQPCLKIKYGRYDSKLFPKSNSEFHDGDMKGFKYQG